MTSHEATVGSGVERGKSRSGSAPVTRSARRPSRFGRALRRLADPRVVSWPAFWIAYVLFTLDGFPVFFGAPLDGSTLGDPVGVLTMGTVSVAGLFAVLLAARHTYLRTRLARRHPSWTIGTFLVASVVGELAGREAVAVVLDHPVSGSFSKLVDTAVYQSLALCVIGTIAVGLADHREAVSSLLSGRERLMRTRDAGLDVLHRERADVVANVTTVVEQALARLSCADAAAAADGLRRTSAGLVRPLSHELSAAAPDFTATPSSPAPRPPWRTVIVESVASPLLDPRVLSWSVVLLAVRLTVRDAHGLTSTTAVLQIGPLTLSADIQPLVKTLVMLGTVFCVTWVSARLANRLAGPMLKDASVSRRWLVTLGSVVFTAALGQGLFWLASRLPGFYTLSEVSLSTNLLLGLLVFIVTVVLGVLRTSAVRHRIIRREIEEINEDLEWEIAKTNEQLWRRRRDLSRQLHGQVQASIVAGAIQLDTALRDDAVTSALLDEVRNRIHSALGGLDVEDPPSVDLRREFELIQNTWRGVCEVRVEVADDLWQRLGSDSSCASAVANIVGEACANAAIHGGATHAIVGLRAVGRRLVEVTVHDDGRGQGAGQPSPGLGRQILDEVTTDWTLTFGEDGTTLRALLPIVD